MATSLTEANIKAAKPLLKPYTLSLEGSNLSDEHYILHVPQLALPLEKMA
ncbi:MAG: hypothetical protein ABIT36_08530 [Steroidobacteraceae bacterium]